MSLVFANLSTSIPDYIGLAVEKNSLIAYLTICLAMFLENIIPPIPSEIIMPLGGFFVYQQKLNFYILVLWGLLGTVLGALPWYYLGRLVNEKRLSNFLDQKGKYLGVSSNDLDKIGAKLTKLTKEQADYINVAVEGPYKPELYRY